MYLTKTSKCGWFLGTLGGKKTNKETEYNFHISTGTKNEQKQSIGTREKDRILQLIHRS